jgi:hypothetical protein
MRRPVTVVLPFHGTAAEAQQTLDALAGLRLGASDELLVVDNTGVGVVPQNGVARVVPAADEQSAYYARNVAAEAAAGDWLLLLDSDCFPPPDLIDRYFAAPIDDDVGAVVGEVVGLAGQTELIARYARSRGHLGQQVHVDHVYRPWGVTANLLVRRAAWEDVGGFVEGVRSTGDTEFSWRLQDAGWRIGYQPEAVVEHEHRRSVRRLVRQAARYGAGRAWLARRYPGSGGRPPLARELARAAAGIAVWTVTARLERATFKALDAVYVSAEWGAWWLSNTPPASRERAGGPAASGTVAIAGAFPSLEDPTAVAAVRRLGGGVVVEAARRPVRIDRAAARQLTIAFAEDDGHARRAAAVAWLLRAAPLRTLRFAGAHGWRGVLAHACAARRLLERRAVRLLDAGGDTAALAQLTGIPLG